MATSLVSLDALSKIFPHGAQPALDGISGTIDTGQVTGLVGPDGAGKTTLMRMLAGLLAPTGGSLNVCGLDPVKEAQALREQIGYMPQRFGLYENLTVLENLTLYADLRGVVGLVRKSTFEHLLGFTDLHRFTGRRAGALSGGMKQKLGLACAILRSPRLLLLDEPSVGVDPISRRELWRMVYTLTAQGVGVVWSTAYLDEAENCAQVFVLNAGRVLYKGDPREMTASMNGRVYQMRGAGQHRRAVLKSALELPEVIDGVLQGEAVRLVLAEGTRDPPRIAASEDRRVSAFAVAPRFEDAVVARLGGQQKRTLHGHYQERESMRGVKPVEARRLTRRFGTFTAAENITFSIERGEIFGLLGPNGAGKSTTFKMMCGLLRPTEGTALVDGLDLYKAPSEARARLGYMAQKFSLYGDLSVRQNLDFFAGAYGLSGKAKKDALDRVIAAFDLESFLAGTTGQLPIGYKQRLALSCATMHEPSVIFLDEPTSGVDPLTRREFWGFINSAVGAGVTVMVTTHFMDEAEYCDRVALIYRGQMIALDTPNALQDRVKAPGLPNPTLEDAFIRLIQDYDREAA